MSETWKPVRSGDYEVSDHGRVRRARPGAKTFVGRLKSPSLSCGGYHVVSLSVDGKGVVHFVHRLVAEAFIGPRPAGHEVNHVDGNKLNNHVSNLEYLTHAENMAHASRAGLFPLGSEHPSSKLDFAQVEAIRRRRHDGESLKLLASEFGVSMSLISSITLGRTRLYR